MEDTKKDTEDSGGQIRQEVISSSNPVLTLITTSDGIPTSSEVTVLTTNLCDVPLMTTSLGGLTDIPIVTTHSNILPLHSHHGTVYTTSIIDPTHVGQAVMVGEGQIAVVETEDGIQQTILVHADPSHLSSLGPVQGQLSQGVIIPVTRSLVSSKPTTLAATIETVSSLPPPLGSESSVIVGENHGDSNPSLESSEKEDTSKKPSKDLGNSMANTKDESSLETLGEKLNVEIEETIPVIEIPNELVCIICYQTYTNPELSSESSATITDAIGTLSPREESSKLSLAKFFELTRVNMSIVTRRSYKDYKVPVCNGCSRKLQDADRIIEEFRKLEKDLFTIRQQIKEEIVNSHSIFKNTENNQEITEKRKNVSGLAVILDVVDRIRNDIISDGKPRKVLTPLDGSVRKRGRKPKSLPRPNPDNPGESETDRQNTSLQQDEQGAGAVDHNADESDKPQLRTSFGRLIKRPTYMRSELTEDDLSELDESSEDDYEEIVVKPDFPSAEGEHHSIRDDEMDEEDPIWSPGRGDLIEAGKVATISSDESEIFSELDSEEETSPKPKTKKDGKDKKLRKSRKIFRRKVHSSRMPIILKPEDMKYEVKVIQLDGTELMTINTSSGSDNIGLDQHLTQKVMDSQAVIMVKNQLYGKRVQCHHCPRTFSDLGRRDIHIKKSHEGQEKPFECEICKKRFRRQDHLKKHVKRHSRPPLNKAFRPRPSTSEKNQSCEFCDLKFRNKSELAVHRRSHTGEKPFKCESCTESFISALKREFHIEQHHPEVPPLRCDHCPKGFFRQHRLRIHAVSHTGEKANICELCGKSFSQAAMLRYHQTTHDELNLKQFKCQECNRVFANPQNLKSHMESQHQKMYRHRCTYCEKGYTQLSHLRRHLRTHTGEKPFSCTYCSKKFTSGAALKIHARIHSGERPFWCSICEKGFRSKTKLGRHMKTLIHSNDKIKKETLATTIETVDVNTSNAQASWTEIVGIISGV